MGTSRFTRTALVWAAMIIALPSPGYAQVEASAPPVSAEDVQRVRDEIDRLNLEFDALQRQYALLISSLERRLDGPLALNVAFAQPLLPDQQPPATPEPSPPVEPPQAAPADPQAQNLAAASKVFNPDIAVIGNFVGVGGANSMSEQSPLSMSEVEVAFQAIVDPYARADFFLSATPEGLEVEEGFATFTTLPSNLLLKVGKMRASFGKVNAIHTHVMPTADRPLVTENLVGGEDGISDSGLSLSKLILNPVMYVEATGEVFSGESNVFQSPERSQLNYVGRVRAYRDVTEGTNIDLGTSFAYGPTDIGIDANKQLFGVDATFRYRPLRRAIYRRFQGRTELIWSRQDIPGAARQNAFGFYGLGEYQFARLWYIGGRYDQSGRTLDASLKDTGGSLFLTYWPSEFSQIRAQYRRTNYAEGTSADELLFQFRFGIGAHAAHVF